MAAMPSINIPTATLCTIARADAVHDYGGELNRELLTETLPVPAPRECIDINNEDTLINAILGLSRIEGVDRFNDSDFKFGDEYHIEYCDSSNLDETLRRFFSTDIGFVVDTYHTEFKNFVNGLRDRPSNSQNNALKYFWIQNKETLYDPADKTTPITPVGREMFTGNPYMHFSWEDNTSYDGEAVFGNMTLHKACNSSIQNLNTTIGIDKSALLYSKYDIIQTLKVSDTPSPSFQSQNGNVLAVLTDYSNPTKIKRIIVDEKAAEKSQALFQIASYRTLFDRYSGILGTALGNPINEASADNYTNIISKYKYILKRLGDQGQALSCLRPITVLYKNRPDSDILQRKLFNNNMCFVTIDRPAFVAAILYRVPIVIYCFNRGGFAVFINKSNIRPEVMLENAKLNYSKQYNDYNQHVSLSTATRNIYGVLESFIYNDISNTIRQYDRELEQYTVNSSITPVQKDTKYRNFMITMFQYRYDMLNFYNNIPIGQSIVFNQPNIINSYTDIVAVNKQLEKISRAYSSTICGMQNAFHTIYRYNFRRKIDNGIRYSVNINTEYDSNLYISLKNTQAVSDNIVITHDELKEQFVLERNLHYAQDELAINQLGELSLFTIQRGDITSERIFISLINRATGLPYIDEYLNALYTYKYDLFIPFKTIFDKITSHMINGRLSDTISATGTILITQIENNASWKIYLKETALSGRKRKRNNEEGQPSKRPRINGGSNDTVSIIVDELKKQEYTAMNRFLEILKNFYRMELEKEKRNHVYKIKPSNIIELDMPLLFINSTLYTIKQYPDLYKKYILIEDAYATASSKIRSELEDKYNEIEDDKLITKKAAISYENSIHVSPVQERPLTQGIMTYGGGAYYKPRNIEYKRETRKKQLISKKTHKKKRV